MFQESISSRRRWLWLWACFACGDRIDDTIRFNRAIRLPETDFQRRARIMREIKVRVQQTVTA
jgi:hypothetical protein